MTTGAELLGVYVEVTVTCGADEVWKVAVVEDDEPLTVTVVV